MIQFASLKFQHHRHHKMDQHLIRFANHKHNQLSNQTNQTIEFRLYLLIPMILLLNYSFYNNFYLDFLFK